MRSFIYLVELILVTILLISYLAYLSPTSSPREYVEKLSREYEISTLCASISRILQNNLDILEVGILNYVSFSSFLKSFSQRIKRYETLKVSFDPSYGCIAILYPFPNIESYYFLSSNSAYFTVVNYENYPCSFNADRDWKYIKLDSIGNPNISIYLIKENLTNLDIYSIFVFDSYGNPIEIEYVSKDMYSINISLDPNYQTQIIKFPIYILFRVKGQSSYPDLIYLKGRYINLTSIVGNMVYQAEPEYANWLTIYINTSCIKKGYLTFKYNILPSKIQTLSDIQANNCYSPVNVTYFKGKFFEYYPLDIEKLMITDRPKSLDYTCSILVKSGLSLSEFTVYGS
ncbi:hypothetical protein BA065_02565 [Nanoarchaeota archaeon NZ13-N]|nr:MAG: hypothetical protein BA065_02565 [Nanoarchaeota archaeon NZ13-N]